MHLAAAFAAAVSRGPDRPFVVSGTRCLTHGQVDREAAALAAAFADLGLESGGRVAVVLPNSPEWVVTLLAAARAGLCVVPVNPSLGRDDLTYQVRLSGATVVVAPDAWADRDFADWFDELLADVPDVLAVVAVGGEDAWYDGRIFPYRDLVSRGMHLAAPSAALEPGDPLVMLYTSGTSGKPKGVVLTHANVLSSAVRTGEGIAAGPEDVSLVMVPCFTVFGTSLIAGAVVAGARVVLVERFDAAAVVAVMAQHGVTLCHGVPTMFALLLREPGFSRGALPQLRSGIVAGSPVSPELVDHIRAVCDVEIAYGLTETGPTVAMTRRDDPPARRRDTVGRLVAGMDAVLLEEAPSADGAGTVGELAVKGPGVMSGYDRMPSETQRSFTPEGYFRTGDLAAFSGDGYVRIVGRRKEMIIRGGFNVVPREVEDVLRAHPAVAEVCVVGAPDDVLGERVCACIVPVEGASVRSEEIQRFARERLADYKVPDAVRFFDVLPLTASGKMHRQELSRVMARELTAR